MKKSAMTFGNKIKEARKQNGLSQEELAKKAIRIASGNHKVGI